MPTSRSTLSTRLEQPAFLTLWSLVAAFGTYACMYGFRKPFTTGSYLGPGTFADEKTWLVVAQVLGYTASKFIGIRVIAEMPPARRARTIVFLIALAEAALIPLGFLPARWGVVCLFLNGLPLGLVFGLVVGFLEGRRQTEALVAGLCASFILADGVAKSVGALLLSRGVSEGWMPGVAGLLYFPPLLGFVWMLQKIPLPTGSDVQARATRTPLDRSARRQWFLRHQSAILTVSLGYLAVTILRSLRADYAPEIWRALGEPGPPGVYTRSELWVALGVVGTHGFLSFISDHRRSIIISLVLSLTGLALAGGALWSVRNDGIPAFPFMVLFGLGLYLPYVAVHTTLFERLIALVRDRGNLGYLMYIADAAGYLGYASVIVLKPWINPGENILEFFTVTSVIALAVALVAFAAAGPALLQAKRQASNQPAGVA